jgi:hypothetical protein
MHLLRSLAVSVVVLLSLVAVSGCGKLRKTAGSTEPAIASAETVPHAAPANPPVAPAPPQAASETTVAPPPSALPPKASPPDEVPAPPAPRVVALAPKEPAKPAPADKEPAPKESQTEEVDLNGLNLEVAALEILHQFKATRPQLERLAKLALITSPKSPAPRPIKVSKEYRKTLLELRDALVEDSDDDIVELVATLDELRDKESPDFDDIQITDSARKHTAEVLRSLGARQVAQYLTDYAEEFPEPLEKITDAFESIRGLTGKEVDDVRDEVAAQVGWLVAGLDTLKENKVKKSVSDLLNRVHRLKDDEFTAQQANLEKQARDIIGDLGPLEVIRHFVDRSLAELLSNPRLGTAVAARLKNME